MANPFPGMDPYLEGNLWPVVHANLATEIARQLNPTLPPNYVALTTQRVVMIVPDNSAVPTGRWPDVGVVAEVPSAGGAVATLAPPLSANATRAETVPLYGVEVVDPENRRLVTAIEILSPTNKQGKRDEYAAKRQELLVGPAHLVEIDLLREGERFPLDKLLPSIPYFAFVSRVSERPKVGIWPMPLRVALPTIPIPLDPVDQDAMLNLQAVLDTLHPVMRYDRSVNYRQSPPGPMSADDLAWIDERLRAAGKRP